MWRQARKLVVFVIGTTVLLIGIIMTVTPGPALVVIPIGLAILATEFVWAKRLLDYAKRRVQEMTQRSSPHDAQSDDALRRTVALPIVIDGHGDVEVFASIETAERALEPIDVRNNVYVAYDSEGYILKLEAGEQRVRVLGRASTKPAADMLAQSLRTFIDNASTIETATTTTIAIKTMSLTELLTLYVQRFGYGV